MVWQMPLAFLTALMTGITLRTPPKAWPAVGITGMLGWWATATLSGRNLPELVAAVSGAVVVGIVAEISARIQKQPVTVYIVSGIIPLVPGITAYSSMLAFLNRRFEEGLFLAFRAFLVATYLSVGLALVPLLVRHLKSWTRRLGRPRKQYLQKKQKVQGGEP